MQAFQKSKPTNGRTGHRPGKVTDSLDPAGARTSLGAGQASRREPRAEEGAAQADVIQEEQTNMFKC